MAKARLLKDEDVAVAEAIVQDVEVAAAQLGDLLPADDGHRPHIEELIAKVFETAACPDDLKALRIALGLDDEV